MYYWYSFWILTFQSTSWDQTKLEWRRLRPLWLMSRHHPLCRETIRSRHLLMTTRIVRLLLKWYVHDWNVATFYSLFVCNPSLYGFKITNFCRPSCIVKLQPEGGVREGECFLTPLPTSLQEDRIQAPTGRWKDGLFDCCSLGICHPSLCCAFWCSKVSMAQIMTRMQLTWLGEHGQAVATKNTFKVSIILAYSTIYVFC